MVFIVACGPGGHSLLEVELLVRDFAWSPFTTTPCVMVFPPAPGSPLSRGTIPGRSQMKQLKLFLYGRSLTECALPTRHAAVSVIKTYATTGAFYAGATNFQS